MNALKKAEKAKQKEGEQNESSMTSTEHKDASVDETTAPKESVTTTSHQQVNEIPTELTLEAPETIDIDNFDELNLTLDEIIVETEPPVQQKIQQENESSIAELQEGSEYEKVSAEVPIPDEPVVELEAPTQLDSDSGGPDGWAQLSETDDELIGESQKNEPSEQSQADNFVQKEEAAAVVGIKRTCT